MRIVGMDIHRSFAQVAVLEEGRITDDRWVDLVHHRLVVFARTLSLEDEVVIEATGNSAAVERVMRPYVRRVLVANSRMVKAIAYARVKTDKIDATILAKLRVIRCRCRDDSIAGPAGELGTDMPDHLEPIRHIIERLADVLTDPTQRAAAGGAGAWRGMDYILARQMLR